MATAMRKTELSPLESLVVERALGDEAHARSANNPLPRIQALTQERQRLYAKSAAHPFLAPMNRARILAIGAEIDLLWEALRRQRATRRTQIERALNVIAEDEDERTDGDERDEHDEQLSARQAERAVSATPGKPATRQKRQKANPRNDTDAA
ncbi:MAG TPA: hypothetical protein VMV29_02275 [Ktedonobacterales bacterium]|nr:hypothetical protein [Ktedonobacterales bacterium]